MNKDNLKQAIKDIDNGVVYQLRSDFMWMKWSPIGDRTQKTSNQADVQNYFKSMLDNFDNEDIKEELSNKFYKSYFKKDGDGDRVQE